MSVAAQELRKGNISVEPEASQGNTSAKGNNRHAFYRKIPEVHFPESLDQRVDIAATNAFALGAAKRGTTYLEYVPFYRLRVFRKFQKKKGL